MVSQRDGRWIQQTRINFQQRLSALESVVNPFCAGVKIGRGAGDYWRGGENGGDIVEERIRALGQAIGLAFNERLVSEAKRVLERVEQLGELEAEELLRIEPGDAVAAIELAELSNGQLPQFMQVDIRAVEVSG